MHKMNECSEEERCSDSGEEQHLSDTEKATNLFS